MTLRVLTFVASLLPMSSVCFGDPKAKFDIPALDFPTAILEFYHQSKVEVLFLSNDRIKHLRTQPIKGEFEPRDALVRMLKGTGLEFEFDSAQSVIIKQPSVIAPPQQPTVDVALAPAPPVLLSPSETHPLSEPEIPQEVVVTGSYIHTATAMDARAPLVELTQSDFDRAPFSTVQDTIYQLPISSLNAPREDFFLYNNYNYGSGVDLRGLGVAATLVLANGHRQPLSGSHGDFVDISNVPMAAVERIEILPDGVSALYGSDAIAGVVNIIMKDDFHGVETQVRYGGALGGRTDLTATQLLGTNWDTGKAMIVYEYRDDTALPASSRGYAASGDKRSYGGGDYRSISNAPANILNSTTLQPIGGAAVNLQDQFAHYQIFSQRMSHSAYGSASQSINDNIETFVEGRITQRNTLVEHFPWTQTATVPGTNPYNTTGAAELVAYSFQQAFGPVTLGGQTRNYVATLGTRFHFAEGWHGELSESYGRETLWDNEYNIARPSALITALKDRNPVTAFNPFGPTNANTLATIAWNNFIHAVSSVETTKGVVDGPLFELPAGRLKIAVGVERREETLDHTAGSVVTPEVTGEYRYSRHVNSAFTELMVPVIGNPDNPRELSRLEVNLAARYDNYSDFGNTTNPEFRLRWVPFNWLKGRASWGTSFRAPKLDDLYDSAANASGLTVLSDPKSKSGKSITLYLQGDNPNLKQETARTWTAGFDLVPTFDHQLSLSATYYSILYQGQITTPASADPFQILVQEAEWGPVITRNPTPTQVAAICNRADFYGPRATCQKISPAAIVDVRLANLSTTRVEGMDFNVSQRIDSNLGRFDLGVNGSYVLHFDQAVTNSSPSIDIANTPDNPLRLRLRGTAGWRQYSGEGLSINVTTNYTNGYTNPGSALVPHVRALTTFDLQLAWQSQKGSGSLNGTELSLNAVNLFNERPPFVDYVYGYDVGNFQPLGRVVSLQARKRW